MTYKITAYREDINLAGLIATLQAAFAGQFAGVITEGSRIVLLLTAAPTPEEGDLFQQLVTDHNPAVLTPDQQTDILGVTDIDGLLEQIATQRATLQTAITNWNTLTTAQQIAVLKRDTIIIDKMLGAFAYLLRHVLIG